MTDVATTVNTYIEGWNETDAERRRELIARTWTEDGSYVDPHFSSDGHDAIDAMIAGVHAQFPGARFTLAGTPDEHHDRVRFSWELHASDGAHLATGLDVGTVADDGRLRSVTGFLER